MIVGKYKVRRLFFAKHSKAGVVDVCTLKKNGKAGEVVKFYRFNDTDEQNIVYLQALDFAKRAGKIKFAHKRHCDRCRRLIDKNTST